MTRLRDRFFPPLPIEERERRLHLLRTLLIVQVVAAVVLVAICIDDMRQVPQAVPWGVTLALALLVLVIAGYLLARRGRLHLGAVLLILPMLPFYGFFIIFYGTRGPVSYVYLWPIMLAAILLETPMIFPASTLVSLLYTAAAVIELYQIWPIPLFRPDLFATWHQPDDPVVILTVYADILTVIIGYYSIAFFARMIIRSLRQAVERSQDRAVALEEARRKAQQMAQSQKRERQTLERAVAAYSDFAQQVAEGDLTSRLSLEDDENPLTLLGKRLNAMAESLHQMNRRLHEAASRITSAATEILAATRQQATGANEQLAAISQTTSTIDEVRKSAEQTAQRAQGVADLAHRTVQVSNTGQQAVADTIGGMEQVEEQVDSIGANITALSRQTQDIEAIIATVNEIAAQSNLLALNAAVEAARAGQAGRGFAVVASEVRSLAEQSRAATERVRDILSQIQTSVDAAVIAAGQGIEGAVAGRQLVDQAKGAIQQLADSVAESTQSAVQIAAAAGQQLSGMEQITQAMENIHQVTVQSATGAQQVERAADELNHLADQLRDLLQQYRLY